MLLPQAEKHLGSRDANQHLSSLTPCSFPCSRRALTEHQLMHDKGRAVQGLERLKRLHHALGAVHTASSGDTAVPNARWDVQKSQDPSHFNSNDGDEAASLLKQLLEPMGDQGFLRLKQLHGKITKGNWNPLRLFDLLGPSPTVSAQPPVPHFTRALLEGTAPAKTRTAK